MNEEWKIDVAGRLLRLPPYLFGRINALRHAKRVAGVDIIDLGMGNPADPPPEATRPGSMPSFAALARTQRMADLASATQAKGSTPWLFLVRYSTAIATIPREAR